MKTINDDPADFFQQKGWQFLQLEDEDDDEMDAISEYEMSEDGFGDSSVRPILSNFQNSSYLTFRF